MSATLGPSFSIMKCRKCFNFCLSSCLIIFVLRWCTAKCCFPCTICVEASWATREVIERGSSATRVDVSHVLLQGPRAKAGLRSMSPKRQIVVIREGLSSGEERGLKFVYPSLMPAMLWSTSILVCTSLTDQRHTCSRPTWSIESGKFLEYQECNRAEILSAKGSTGGKATLATTWAWAFIGSNRRDDEQKSVLWTGVLSGCSPHPGRITHQVSVVGLNSIFSNVRGV